MFTKLKNLFKKKDPPPPEVERIGLVCQIKLTTGEEIIGFLVGSTSDNRFLVQEPMVVTAGFDEDPQINLQKYVWFSENSIVIFEKSHIVSVVQVTQLVKEYYFNSIIYSNKVLNAATNSDIKQATDNLREVNKNATTIPDSNRYIHPGTDSIN